MKLQPNSESGIGYHCFEEVLLVYHQRNFILVTDHKPLLALFGPSKPISCLAANCLAHWALFLSRFINTIEYQKANHHKNAVAFRRLLSSENPAFDNEENEDVVCATHAFESNFSWGISC